MGIFDRLFKREEPLPELNVPDSAVVAMTDGTIVDIKTVPDPMFAEELLGKSIAFRFDKDKVMICSPANGELSALYPTGHAFGITTNEGVDLLVHIGVDTVNAKGDGFRLMGKKRGDRVKAGEPIVEADVRKLSQHYDMSTMLIITNPNGKDLTFIEPQDVVRGQSVLK